MIKDDLKEINNLRLEYNEKLDELSHKIEDSVERLGYFSLEIDEEYSLIVLTANGELDIPNLEKLNEIMETTGKVQSIEKGKLRITFKY
jgi:hypothetical protein